MTYLLNEAAFDYRRNRIMQNTIMAKNEFEGYHLTIPKHCVSANYEITFKKFGYYPRQARVIDPNRLGFANEKVKTHFILPYETFGIMEAQEFYNSRNFANFPGWKSNLFEQHGHNHLNFYLDTQRPGLIDVNIRELAQFIEIRNLEVHYTKFGFFDHATWTIREFDNSGAVDEYMKSDKKAADLYVESKRTTKTNVFNLYNSYSLESKFYEGHENEDFDIVYARQYLQDIKEAA